MVGALAKALAQAGHEACIVTPLYRGIRDKFPEMRHVDWYLNLPMGSKMVNAQLWSLEPQPGLDGQYTIFGGVIEGMAVVDKIQVGDHIKKVTLASQLPK